MDSDVYFSLCEWGTKSDHVTLLKNLFLHTKMISYILANTELFNGIQQESRKRRQIPM